jgi:hypothetical protein
MVPFSNSATSLYKQYLISAISSFGRQIFYHAAFMLYCDPDPIQSNQQ